MKAKSIIQEHFYLMTNIQKSLLNFLEDNANTEENFENFKTILDNSRICNDKHDLRLLLRLINNIANNHHCGPHFHNKIEKILRIFIDTFKSYYSNTEIFNIFKSSKRILLFLIEEKVLIFDEYVVKSIINSKKINESNYLQFFQPEIKPFIDEKWICKYVKYIKKELPDNFYALRKNGENENPICQLIQNNLTKDFIAYINKNNISLDTKIHLSVYETNSFLIEKFSFSLIEYAAFFGSIEIFNYLHLNGVELRRSLWEFAIYGQNSEIIHILEDNHIEPEYYCWYQDLFIQSIKCHHNDITNYILNFYLQNNEEEEEEEYSKILFYKSLKYYNFALIKIESINESFLFYRFCKYDYYSLVKILLKNYDIDINKKIPSFTGEYNSYELWEKMHAKEEKSPLFIAVKKENIEIITLLLENEKIDVNTINIEYTQYGRGWSSDFYVHEKTPLSVAVEKENFEIIILLLNNKKLDVNIQYNKYRYENDIILETNENTPLYMAIEKENIEIIKLLLKNENIDPNILFKCEKWKYGFEESCWHILEMTPLCRAVEKENIEIITLLLNNEKIDINILCKFGEQKRKEKEIINNDIEKYTAFYIAVEQNNIEILRLLLTNQNIDISIPHIIGETANKTVLCEAVENDNIEIIKLLLSLNKIDINETSKIRYHYHYKEKKGGEFLGELMGLVTESMEDALQEITAFYIAVQDNKIDIIQLLLNVENIDINIPCKCYYYKDKEWIARFEKTAFYEAVEKEYIDIIILLLNNGNINVNIPFKGEGKIDNNIIVEAEKPAFYLAVEKKSNEIIQLLLNNDKLDINFPYKCHENMTFDIKSHNEIINAIQSLFNDGKIDVNIKDKKVNNQTRVKSAFRLTLEKGYFDITTKLLLSNKNIYDDDAKYVELLKEMVDYASKTKDQLPK